ncbi:hypothetical protein TSMEX_002770 [Taenia solium]|eukprot:TsM_000205700 transcript=TsM_000205700 gene=TsM_000205700
MYNHGTPRWSRNQKRRIKETIKALHSTTLHLNTVPGSLPSQPTCVSHHNLTGGARKSFLRHASRVIQDRIRETEEVLAIVDVQRERV